MSDQGLTLGGDEPQLPATAGSAGAAEGGVRAITLGQRGGADQATRLSGLERMNERLARLLRVALEPLANARTQVVARPLATLPFGSWRDGLGDFHSLSMYRPRPLKGTMLVAMDPAFVAAMVDSFYGGSGIVPVPKGPEFSTSEERLIVRLTEIVIRILTESWAEVLPLAPELAQRESNPSYAATVRPDDTVVVQAFEVVAGQARPAVLQIVYPLASLRPIADDLAHKVHEEEIVPDEGWRLRLADALQEVRLPVRSVLARPEISVAQLLALKVGDVIPITMSATAPLIVGTKQLAAGVIGEQEGKAALQIQAIGNADTQERRR